MSIEDLIGNKSWLTISDLFDEEWIEIDKDGYNNGDRFDFSANYPKNIEKNINKRLYLVQNKGLYHVGQFIKLDHETDKIFDSIGYGNSYYKRYAINYKIYSHEGLKDIQFIRLPPETDIEDILEILYPEKKELYLKNTIKKLKESRFNSNDYLEILDKLTEELNLFILGQR